MDAPLDDHNVERYRNLMDEMAFRPKRASWSSRIIRITMARMNRLFGVTMGEQA